MRMSIDVMHQTLFALRWLQLTLLLINRSNGLSKTQPNFIFILADDQDDLFNSSDIMPNLQKYLVKQGMSFTSAYVSTPICCPSRIETIAGRNYHNVGAPHGECMHVKSQEFIFNDSNSMFKLFQNNGYLTSMFGKLSNDQDAFWCDADTPTVINFDRIHAPCDVGNFYGTKLSQCQTLNYILNIYSQKKLCNGCNALIVQV